jgi:hypothetical protein
MFKDCFGRNHQRMYKVNDFYIRIKKPTLFSIIHSNGLKMPSVFYTQMFAYFIIMILLMTL